MSTSDTENNYVLPADTLAILNEFYAEQAEKEEKLKLLLDKKEELKNETVTFEENWQLSQFWYDDETANCLAKEACRVAGGHGSIALISCPSLYKVIKKQKPHSQVVLFEYDHRFAVYGQDFIFYDYNSPLEVPKHLEKSFDLVVADPPFLSEECLTKTAMTVKFLTSRNIILCTGAVMENLSRRLLDVRKSGFEPRHKNNLANDFLCYTNYGEFPDIK
uniref:Protein-lysine N-methyltransferase TDIB3V08_LOCUS4058 n=1 Tax=Timema douglasi TaxID=61478 RepID=A0A7R8VFW9_TIMDO|nr:unnamed protein product [Timema douglasi]